MNPVCRRITEALVDRQACPKCGKKYNRCCRCSSKAPHNAESLAAGHGMTCENGHRWTYGADGTLFEGRKLPGDFRCYVKGKPNGKGGFLSVLCPKCIDYSEAVQCLNGHDEEHQDGICQAHYQDNMQRQGLD